MKRRYLIATACQYPPQCLVGLVCYYWLDLGLLWSAVWAVATALLAFFGALKITKAIDRRKLKLSEEGIQKNERAIA